MATYKHLVESGRLVIFDGVRYKPDSNNYVFLPGIFKTSEVRPLERPTPDEVKRRTKDKDDEGEEGEGV